MEGDVTSNMYQEGVTAGGSEVCEPADLTQLDGDVFKALSRTA